MFIPENKNNMVYPKARESIPIFPNSTYENEFPLILPVKHVDKTETTRINLEKFINESGIGTVTVENEYGTMKVSLISFEEAVKKEKLTMSRKHTAFVYYSAIWYISAVILCFFITAGFSGLTGPLTSTSGSILSVIGIAGAIIDWKDWNKRNAD